MKAILVFLLIAAVSTNEVEIFDFTEGPTAADFIKGFLEGIDEKKSIDDMILCINSIEEVIKKIIDALELIKKFDFENIVEGISRLLAALKELSDAVRPCSNGYKVLEKLIQKIYSADYKKVLQILLQKSFILIGYISNAISCFTDQKLECAGKNVGSVLKVLFLEGLYRKPTAEIDAIRFLKGFLDGIGSTSDHKNLDKCIKDIENLIEAIEKAFNAIKKGDIQGIIEGVRLIIFVTIEFIGHLQLCVNDDIIKKLINAIKNFDLMKTVFKIVGQLTKVIAIIQKTLDCIKTADYYCIGHGFGSFLKIALL